jgi:hypothetical protein
MQWTEDSDGLVTTFHSDPRTPFSIIVIILRATTKMHKTLFSDELKTETSNFLTLGQTESRNAILFSTCAKKY